MNAANVKRFTARSSREALALVRQAFGEDAVVLSTRPSDGGGVEVLAMAPEGIGQIEKVHASAPIVRAAEPAPAAKAAAKQQPNNASAEVNRDVEQLAMSTLSFQDYVRDRMLKRAAPRLKVLGPSEIPETHSIRIASVIGAAA